MSHNPKASLACYKDSFTFLPPLSSFWNIKACLPTALRLWYSECKHYEKAIFYVASLDIVITLSQFVSFCISSFNPLNLLQELDHLMPLYAYCNTGRLLSIQSSIVASVHRQWKVYFTSVILPSCFQSHPNKYWRKNTNTISTHYYKRRRTDFLQGICKALGSVFNKWRPSAAVQNVWQGNYNSTEQCLFILFFCWDK
jgi:hypothetical protein